MAFTTETKNVVRVFERITKHEIVLVAYDCACVLFLFIFVEYYCQHQHNNTFNSRNHILNTKNISSISWRWDVFCLLLRRACVCCCWTIYSTLSRNCHNIYIIVIVLPVFSVIVVVTFMFGIKARCWMVDCCCWYLLIRLSADGVRICVCRLHKNLVILIWSW